MTETAQRAGHIPKPRTFPGHKRSNEDGTFKSYDDLKKLYDSKGINGKDEVHRLLPHRRAQLPYLVVLKYLLGFNQVRNYDGSWTEWGNLIGAPIVNETRAAQPRWPPLLVRPVLVSQASACALAL